jgi:hypothetical protein
MYLMGSHKLKLKTEALIVYGRGRGVGVCKKFGRKKSDREGPGVTVTNFLSLNVEY